MQIVKSTPIAVLEEGIFTSIGERTIWVEEINRESGELGNIVLYSRNESEGWDIVRAKRGIWKQNPDGSRTLHLFRGRLFSSEFSTGTYSYIDFSSGSLEIMMSASRIAHHEDEERINPGELNSFELLQMLMSLEQSYTEDRDSALFWVEFYKKQSIPFSCLVFSLIGAPLGVFSKRSGRGIGFSISIIIFFIYYVLFMFGQSMAIKGVVHPFFGVWNANIILLIVGVLLLIYKEKIEAMSIEFEHLIQLLKRGTFLSTTKKLL